MQLCRGNTRTVLLLPGLGIAVKFARIKILDVRAILWRNRRNWPFIRKFLTDPPSNWYSLRWHLLEGVRGNLSEARFYFATRNAFAWPTLFSCGLFSIQRIGTPCDLDEGELFRRIISVVGMHDVREDGHCFSNPANFCVDGHGKLYLLDYASPTSQVILAKHEKKLREML